MEELKELLREYVKRNQMLESANEQLRDKLFEQDKLRKTYIDDLNNMKTSLNHFQDALMKCRANMLSHEMVNKSHLMPGDTSEASCNGSTTDVVIFQAQVEIYKNDLSQQQAAYEDLLIEKNRITAELQTLLQKNHQLSMDHAKHRGDLSGHNPSRTRPTEGVLLYGTSPGVFERQIEPCPHCNNVFGDFLTLETHIKDCPGLDY